MTLVYGIGLGSNLGDRDGWIAAAVEALRDQGVVEAISTVIESEAVTLDGVEQPAYRNAVVRLSTALTPLAMLDACLDIERRLGRTRTQRWGPRTIDLDLLIAFENGLLVRWQDARLTLPHRWLAHRPFALGPLLEVVPEALASYRDAWRAMQE